MTGSNASDLTGVSCRGLSAETSQAPFGIRPTMHEACQPAVVGQQTPWNGSKACRTCYLLVSRASETTQKSTPVLAHTLCLPRPMRLRGRPKHRVSAEISFRCPKIQSSLLCRAASAGFGQSRPDSNHLELPLKPVESRVL